MKFESFRKVSQGLFLSFPLAGDIHFEALGKETYQFPSRQTVAANCRFIFVWFHRSSVRFVKVAPHT